MTPTPASIEALRAEVKAMQARGVTVPAWALLVLQHHDELPTTDFGALAPFDYAGNWVLVGILAVICLCVLYYFS